LDLKIGQYFPKYNHNGIGFLSPSLLLISAPNPVPDGFTESARNFFTYTHSQAGICVSLRGLSRRTRGYFKEE
jgi:hypothetical protein